MSRGSRFARFLPHIAVALAPLAVSPPAIAQPAAPAAARPASAPASGMTQLEQVTVTASKRTQFLLDVPYAVTPIGADEIASRGVLDLKDMQSVVPSLFITESNPGFGRIQLRGISTLNGLPTVGTYLDEMPLDLAYAIRTIDIPLVDMARIEVLRGPQGTLYGASSLGGMIRFVTQAPRLGVNEYAGEAGVRKVASGGYGWHANAMANLPFGEGSGAVRFVAGHEKIPGWIDNSVSAANDVEGLAGQKNINDATRTYLRGKVLYRLTPSFDASLLLYHSQLDADYPTVSGPDKRASFRVASPTRDHNTIANLVLTADLGAATLVSATGYLSRDIDATVDLSNAAPALRYIRIRQDETNRVFTQEVRLNSNAAGPFSWTTGAFYRNMRNRSTNTTDVVLPTGMNVGGPPSVTTYPFDSRQWAVFGEATYQLAKAWSATAGLRYFRDRQTFEQSQPVADAAEQTVSATSPRVSLLWRHSREGSVYATAAKGFRSGGFNGFGTTPRTYDPETLWSYEIGARGSLWDDRLAYDVAVYHSRYKDVQGQFVTPTVPPRTVTLNTGKASGTGLDVALSAAVTPHWTLQGAAGYVDITYDTTNVDRNEGDPLNYIPRLTSSASSIWHFNWLGSRLPGMVRFDYQHADRFVVINRTFAPSPVYTSGTIDSFNLRFGIEMPKWQVYLDGRNLTNNYADISPNLGGSVPGEGRPTPRSVGVTYRAQF